MLSVLHLVYCINIFCFSLFWVLKDISLGTSWLMKNLEDMTSKCMYAARVSFDFNI